MQTDGALKCPSQKQQFHQILILNHLIIKELVYFSYGVLLHNHPSRLYIPSAKCFCVFLYVLMKECLYSHKP